MSKFTTPNEIGLPIPGQEMVPNLGTDPCQVVTTSGVTGTVKPIELPVGSLWIPLGKK